MKTTFTSKEIAHVWAHKSAPCGKSPGAMSFRGDSFYSYGTVIARHITHKGNSAVLLNDTSYSNTTAKHKGLVRSALPGGVPIFHLGGLGMGVSLDFSGEEGKRIFDYAIDTAAACLTLAAKAKGRKGAYEAQAVYWMERAKEANQFFGLRRKVDDKSIDRLRVSAARAEREAQEKRKQAEAKRRIEQTEAFEAWKLGTGSSYEFDDHLFPVAFRIEQRSEGDSGELVSSKGARVPLDAARVALRFVLKHRDSGWHRNGSTCQVGNYQLDAINAQGIVAGCHRITWEEVERVATMLA